METINSTLIKADYKSIAQQSYYLLEERLVFKYISKWSEALSDFCESTGESPIKLEAVFDKFTDKFFLKVSQKSNVNKYPISVSGVKLFVLENADWISDVSAWYDVAMEDFNNLVDDLDYVKTINPTDTFVAMGDPHVGVSDK